MAKEPKIDKETCGRKSGIPGNGPLIGDRSLCFLALSASISSLIPEIPPPIRPLLRLIVNLELTRDFNHLGIDVSRARSWHRIVRILGVNAGRELQRSSLADGSLHRLTISWICRCTISKARTDNGTSWQARKTTEGTQTGFH